jgi:glycosidase
MLGCGSESGIAASSSLSAASVSIVSPGSTDSGVKPGSILSDQADVGFVDPGSKLSQGWRHQTFMQVYVRAYRDSNGDGVGDLQGLIQSLDYLQWLGIRALWLMPITQSQDRDHGYAVSDFRQIETDYGSLADFDELIKQAHARGIAVVIDHVINHSAATHPAFMDARSNAHSPFRSWYVFQNTPSPSWQIFGSNPWRQAAPGSSSDYYFAAFSPTMPEFDWRNTAMLQWHLAHMRFWLNRGVDGFRLDAVSHLVENGPNDWYDQEENHRILAQVRTEISRYDNRYLVCEAVGKPLRYAAQDSCGRAFAFGFGPLVLRAARGDKTAFEPLVRYIRDMPGDGALATMLANHDAFAGNRVWDQLGGDQTAYRLAAALYLLQLGTPFIYYGEEIGLSGGQGLSGDPSLRTPMVWNSKAPLYGFSDAAKPFRNFSSNAADRSVESQKHDPASLLHHYRNLVRLRAQRLALAQGELLSVQVNGTILQMERRLGSEHLLMIYNLGDQVQPLVSDLFLSSKKPALIFADYPGMSREAQLILFEQQGFDKDLTVPMALRPTMPLHGGPGYLIPAGFSGVWLLAP